MWLGALVPAVLALMAVFTVDAPAARAQLLDVWPGAVVTLIDHVEVFGDGLGVLLILAAVYCLDPTRRRRLPRLMVCCYGAGIAANIVKAIVGRHRPFQWLNEVTEPGAIPWDGTWLPLGTNGTAWQSFPSGHTATAVGLALGLTKLYPQGGRFFATLAAVVAVQRVMTDMHFVSDVLAAASLAWLTTAALYGRGPIARRFDQFEAAKLSHAPDDISKKLAA